MFIGSNRAAIMSFKTGDRVFGSGVLFVFASSYFRGDSCHRKGTKRQTMITNAIHRNIKIEQK